jgi:glucose-6-phosphate isomerase
MSGTGATASQAWAILKRHARDEIKPLRLQELCRDNDRVSSLVAVYNATPERMLLVDLSRQRMTLETINHLLRLATARQVKKYITQLAWGKNDPDNPIVPLRLRPSAHSQSQSQSQSQSSKTTRFEEADQGGGKRRPVEEPSAHAQHLVPSLHLSLRAPANQGLEMLTTDGTNALTAIHRDWGRLQRISDSMRRGQLPGVTGSMIKDVVVVGRGVPIQALRFIYLALLKDEAASIGRRVGLSDPRRQSYGQRRIKFLTSVDPIRAAAVVADLDPASTLVISIALRGNEETAVATRTMKNWLLQSLGSGRRPEVVLSKHMMTVTGNERVAAAHKPESVFLVPEHSRCEAFTTFTAATLLVSVVGCVSGYSLLCYTLF